MQILLDPTGHRVPAARAAVTDEMLPVGNHGKS